MVVQIQVDGVSKSYPENGNEDWGPDGTDFAVAIAAATLQHVGGSFFLTANVDFGPNFGLVASSYSSRGSSPATAGVLRLSNTDTVGIRNFANTGNLLLGVNSSNQLTFDGTPLEGAISSVTDTATIDLTLASLVLSAAIVAGSITDSYLSAGAAITRSKLAAGTANTLAYNNGSGVLSDLTALTASRLLVSDSSGLPTTVATTATEAGYLSGVSSALQSQIDNKLALAGGTLTGGLTLATDPSSALQAATKQYVDAVAQGLQVKDAVIAASTSAGTLATDFDNGSTVGGVVIQTGDRIIIKNQVDSTANGIYVAQAAGAPVRSTDADVYSELVGAVAFVSSGTLINTSWATNIPTTGTLGSTSITFAQFAAGTSYTADGQGIELSGTTFSLELDGSTLSKSASGLKVTAGGISNTEVGASAAIDRSKIAVGTVNRLVVNDGSTGALSDLAALTASRVMVTNASAIPASSSVTSTTLAFLDATSSVQTQLNARLPLTGGALTGAVTSTNTITTTSGLSAGWNVQAAVFNSSLVAKGNSGATSTVDWNAGVNQSITLTGSPSCTFTFIAPPAGTIVRLIATQGSGGSKTASYPATVKWAGGTAPTLSTSAGQIDVLSWLFDGTNFYGVGAINFA